MRFDRSLLWWRFWWRRRLPAGPELLAYVAGGVSGSGGEGDSFTLRGGGGGADATSGVGTLRGAASGTGGTAAVLGAAGTLRGVTQGNGGGAMAGCEAVGVGAVILVSTSVN
jgi:hypothetical protein